MCSSYIPVGSQVGEIDQEDLIIKVPTSKPAKGMQVGASAVFEDAALMKGSAFKIPLVERIPAVVIAEAKA